MTSSFSFTKLVVHDLERMAAFYREAYDLHGVRRVHEKIGEEPIDEIMLSPDPQAAFGTIVLLRFLERPAAPRGEVILGFTTDDLPALLERVCAAGGSVHAPIQEMSQLSLRVAFVKDPEGHLAELVQMLG